MVNIDSEIMDWIEDFDIVPKDEVKLLEYIKNNLIKDEEAVIDNFVELWEVNLPDNNTSFLDIDYVLSFMVDGDWTQLSNGKYLNVYYLSEFNWRGDLKEMGLVE